MMPGAAVCCWSGRRGSKPTFVGVTPDVGLFCAHPAHGRAHPLGMLHCPPMPTVNQSEAARILGISRRTVKRRIEAGDLASVDTPEGLHVVLPDEPAPTPAHGHAHPDAQGVPTHDDDFRRAADFGTGVNFPRAEDLHTGVNFPTRGDFASARTDELATRLERAEGRIDRLLDTVHAQNQTIQAQTIRLAQLEHRMIDAAPSQTPAEPPEQAAAPDIPAARIGGLRGLYMRWRGGH